MLDFAVCEASVNTISLSNTGDTLVHLAASFMSGNASAVAVLARFGPAARGEPVCEADELVRRGGVEHRHGVEDWSLR